MIWQWLICIPRRSAPNFINRLKYIWHAPSIECSIWLQGIGWIYPAHRDKKGFHFYRRGLWVNNSDISGLYLKLIKTITRSDRLMDLLDIVYKIEFKVSYVLIPIVCSDTSITPYSTCVVILSITRGSSRLLKETPENFVQRGAR